MASGSHAPNAQPRGVRDPTQATGPVGQAAENSGDLEEVPWIGPNAAQGKLPPPPGGMWNWKMVQHYAREYATKREQELSQTELKLETMNDANRFLQQWGSMQRSLGVSQSVAFSQWQQNVLAHQR